MAEKGAGAEGKFGCLLLLGAASVIPEESHVIQNGFKDQRRCRATESGRIYKDREAPQAVCTVHKSEGAAICVPSPIHFASTANLSPLTHTPSSREIA